MTFHGTPDRWRATNIAFKGFDTNIILNGRAQGNGVYSSIDINTPIGYARQNGSALQLHGIAVEQIDAINTPIYVFRDPNRVLVETIIDFAPTTAEDMQLNGEERYAEIVRAARVKHARETREIQQKEERFIEQYIIRMKTAQNYYINTMLNIVQDIHNLWERIHLLNVDVDVDAAADDYIPHKSECGCDTLAEAVSVDVKVLWGRYQRELLQYRGSHYWKAKTQPQLQEHQHTILPIYCDKLNLIQKLKEFDVVVVSAGTGSGKSTQIPQYLFDEIFNHSKSHATKKIAVLQPRRINAISLCSRVSQERRKAMGMEVGYSLGGGDVCTSASTRIEFMTHGLFINRALDPQSLLDKYCAVVLDEAHFRSIEVDMCFALLRRCFLFQQQQQQQQQQRGTEDRAPRFKVVVASATITDVEMENFRDFLAPALEKDEHDSGHDAVRGTIHTLSSNAFPVQILYRPEAEPDWVNANSLETSEALTSYATECALRIIEMSESDGNILIFLPSESLINRSIQNMAQWSIFNTTKDRETLDEAGETTNTKSSSEKLQGESVDFSPFQSFKIRIPGKKRKDELLHVGVYPFHGKTTDSVRQRLMDHKKFGQDRIIIFSTNIAETGLTLPNVRYVIDTGLERRVIWNRKTCTQEMRTVQVTKSSMQQRTGRAGRVSSGICMRLYSKETAELLQDSPDPEIENGMILKTVLTLISIEKKQQKERVQLPLILLTDIPEESRVIAEKCLRDMGAIDRDKEITHIGQKLLQIGLNLRWGRFLLACSATGCLSSGVNIVSLATVSNCLSLLPQRQNISTYNTKEMVDSHSDHFTLGNIFENYIKATILQGETGGISFCQEHDFELSIFEEAMRNRTHLDEVLTNKLDLVVADEDEVTEDENLLRNRLLQALCSAYFDQILIANASMRPEKKFIRLLERKDRQRYREAAHQLAIRGGFITGDESNCDDDDDDDNDKDNVDDENIEEGASTVTNTSSCKTSPTQEFSADDMISLSSSSSLWTISVKKGKGDNDKDKLEEDSTQLAVFSSIMLTDTSRGGIVQLVSYVNAEHIKEGGKAWYDHVNFPTLAKNFRMVERSYPISATLLQALQSNKGSLLRQHFNSCENVSVTYEKSREGGGDGVLCVTAPNSMHTAIQLKISKLENLHYKVAASINFKDLTRPQVSKIVKFFGHGNNLDAKKIDFVKALNNMVADALGEVKGNFNAITASDISVTTTKKLGTPNAINSGSKCGDSVSIKVNLGGTTKQFTSLIIGVLQNKAAEVGEFEQSRTIEYPQIELPSSVDHNMNIESKYMNERLTLMSSRLPPPIHANAARKDIMLYVAHSAIWTAKGCSVYGGFVRDTILRGEESNDIDLGFDNNAQLPILRNVVINSAQHAGWIYRGEQQKGLALALTFSCQTRGVSPFQVDLVHTAAVRAQSLAPGVDCDVGNLMMQISGADVFGLTLKINNPTLLSKAISLKHCLNKQFVFYYQEDGNGVAQRRLKKYLDRGWTCLSPLIGGLKNWAESIEAYKNLLKPSPKYSHPFI